MRITLAVKTILNLFLSAKPQSEWCGVQIREETDLPSGTISPILRRFEEAGWLLSRWEAEKTAFKAGRPRRRYYRMTPEGRKQAREKEIE